MYKSSYKMFPCDCGCALICIDHDEDLIFVSVYGRGHCRDDRLTWKERFRWAWNLLTTGQPYSDEFVLTKEKALDLGNELISRVELME